VNFFRLRTHIRAHMSFDLYFCRPDTSTPSIPELKEYFSSVPHFQVNDVQAGVEFLYQNEVTGVYCGFSYSRLDAAELQGCGSTGLTFNLNFNRPSFFAYETMPLVEDFCNRFNLVVENPQDETVQQPDAKGLIASWRRHNTHAMKRLATEEDMKLHYLPEASATAWWRYMRVQQALDDTITEDIFVPSLMILMNPASQLFTMLLWPKGIAQFFPRSDYVYLQRDKKSLFRTKEENGLISYDSVIAKIEHLLEDYDFGGLHIKYLPPEKTSQVIPLIQSFNLEPVDLRQYTRITPDSFHDVGDSD
jgi:hypothetical protein